MCTISRVALCVIALVSLWGCDDGSTSSSGGNAAVEACVRRGVAYFKEVGSYPTLQSEPNVGRGAEVVARERCQKSTAAF